MWIVWQHSNKMLKQLYSLILLVLLCGTTKGVSKWRILQQQITEIQTKQIRQEIEIEDLKEEINKRKEVEENLKEELNSLKQVEAKLRQELDRKIEDKLRNCRCQVTTDRNSTSPSTRKRGGLDVLPVSESPNDRTFPTVRLLQQALFSEKLQRKRFENKIIEAQELFVRNNSADIQGCSDEVHNLGRRLRKTDKILSVMKGLQESQNNSLSEVEHGLNNASLRLEKMGTEMHVVFELVKYRNTSLFDSVVYNSWSEWQTCSLSSPSTTRQRTCTEVSKGTVFCPRSESETKPCPHCPEGYQEITYDSVQKTCLQYFRILTRYSKAEEFCKPDGGHLVLIDSESKQAAVMDYLKEKYALYVFIDGRLVDDMWFNWRNEPMRFFNWQPGEPVGRHPYLIMSAFHNYKWRNSGIKGAGILCEIITHANR